MKLEYSKNMFLSVYYAPMLISKAGVPQVYLPEAELTWSPCRASLEVEWQVLPPRPAGLQSSWPAESTNNRCYVQVPFASHGLTQC